MLSCDPRLALCMLVQLVCLALPCRFVSVMRGLIQTPDDTSDEISFRVKGGLVIELCFRVCLNDGLGSFVGRAIFIFSPSPLGSA
jgi:hypothetical protein